MSKPSILTQILDAVKALDTKVGALDTKVGALDTKVGALETQVGQLEENTKKLETVANQLIALDAKVSDIQSMLNVGELPLPKLT